MDPNVGSKMAKAMPAQQNRTQMLGPILDPPSVGSCGLFLGSLGPLFWLWASAMDAVWGRSKLSAKLSYRADGARTTA